MGLLVVRRGVVGAGAAPEVAPFEPGPYAEAVLDSEPDGYWRLNEESGATAFDLSGGGLHGEYVGGVTLGEPGPTDDDDSRAVYFPGLTSAYMVIPDAAATRARRPLTFECWLRTVVGSRARDALVSAGYPEDLVLVPPPPAHTGEPQPTVADPKADGYYCGAIRSRQQLAQDRANGIENPWPWCRLRAGRGTDHVGAGSCRSWCSRPGARWNSPTPERCSVSRRRRARTSPSRKRRTLRSLTGRS